MFKQKYLIVLIIFLGCSKAENKYSNKINLLSSKKSEVLNKTIESQDFDENDEEQFIINYRK